jgi:hypothetical protein
MQQTQSLTQKDGPDASQLVFGNMRVGVLKFDMDEESMCDLNSNEETAHQADGLS